MVPAWQVVALVVGGVVVGALFGAVFAVSWQRRWDRKHGDQLVAVAADFARRRSIELGSVVAQRMTEETAATLIRSVPGPTDLEEYLGYSLKQADPAWVLGAMTVLEMISKNLNKTAE